MKDYPVSKTQKMVLEALNMAVPETHREATEVLKEIGLVVSSKRQGRSTVPVVRHAYYGGGFNAYGEGEEEFCVTNIDTTPIEKWME